MNIIIENWKSKLETIKTLVLSEKVKALLIKYKTYWNMFNYKIYNDHIIFCGKFGGLPWLLVKVKNQVMMWNVYSQAHASMNSRDINRS